MLSSILEQIQVINRSRAHEPGKAHLSDTLAMLAKYRRAGLVYLLRAQKTLTPLGRGLEETPKRLWRSVQAMLVDACLCIFSRSKQSCERYNYAETANKVLPPIAQKLLQQEQIGQSSYLMFLSGSCGGSVLLQGHPDPEIVLLTFCFRRRMTAFRTCPRCRILPMESSCSAHIRKGSIVVTLLAPRPQKCLHLHGEVFSKSYR